MESLSMPLRRALRLLPFVATLIALPFVVDLRQMVVVFTNVDAPLLALAVVMNFLTRTSAAERNQAISRAARLPVSRLQAIEALFIANFWSLALPGVSAGGVATVLRYRSYGVPASQGLAVLAASRILEMIAFAALALLGWTLASPGGAQHFHTLGMVAALTAAGGMLRRLPPAALLRGLAFALLQGLLDAATVCVLAQALGLSVALPQALWINALSYFAILLPLSVAGLGVREAAVIIAIVPLGFSRESALALALLMLSMTLLNAAVGGVLQALSGRRTLAAG
jgi:uncharacterized membrane protein YbhN (UPF0104 family)